MNRGTAVPTASEVQTSGAFSLPRHTNDTAPMSAERKMKMNRGTAANTEFELKEGQDMGYKAIPRTVATEADLDGTIAAMAISGEAAEVVLDVSGHGYRCASKVKVSTAIMQRGITETKTGYALGPITPLVDRLVQAHQIGDTRTAQETLGMLIRTRNQELHWSLEKALNVRGIGCFGGHLPDHKIPMGCVLIHPSTAAGMLIEGVPVDDNVSIGEFIRTGDVVELYGSPEFTARAVNESGCIPVMVVLDDFVDPGCIYFNPIPIIFPNGKIMPLGKVADRDCDGDQVALRVPYGSEAELEMRLHWVAYWDGCEYVNYIPELRTWKNEVGVARKNDREAFDAKVLQKPSTPSLTEAAWALWALAMDDKENFRYSYNSLIPFAFKLIRAAMGLKHAAIKEGQEVGAQLILNAMKPRTRITPEMVEQLKAEGYNPKAVAAVREYLITRGKEFQNKPFRDLTDAAGKLSLGFRLKTVSGPKTHPTVEAFLMAAKEQNLDDNIVDTFLKVVTGKIQMAEPTWVPPYQTVSQAGAYLGSDFKVSVNAKDKYLDIKCGLVSLSITFDPTAQAVLWGGRTLIFRPVCYVSEWSEDGDPVKIKSVNSWGTLITEFANKKYKFVIRQIRATADLDSAEKLLDGLIRKVMKHVRVMFETDDPGASQGVILNKFREAFIRSQVMTMDLAIPFPGMDILVRSLTACAEHWVQNPGSGVERFCDTLAGEPGRVMLKVNSEHLTVTQAAWPQCAVKEIPVARYPVLHQTGNAADLADPDPAWVAVKYVQPEHVHLLCAALPMFLLDAVLMTEEAMHKARPVRRYRNKAGEIETVEMSGRPGMKVQCPIADIKGLAAKFRRKMIVKWANGETTPLDLAFAYESEGHQMMTATQTSMAVYTMAWSRFQKTGHPIAEPPAGMTIEKAAATAVASGLYDDDSLSCELYYEDTGEKVVFTDNEKGVSYEKFPVGWLPIITHRQHPDVLSTVAFCPETPEVYSGGCKGGGPVHGGYSSIFMHAGMPAYIDSTFCVERIPADLVQYIQDLTDMIEFDPTMSEELHTASRNRGSAVPAVPTTSRNRGSAVVVPKAEPKVEPKVVAPKVVEKPKTLLEVLTYDPAEMITIYHDCPNCQSWEWDANPASTRIYVVKDGVDQFIDQCDSTQDLCEMILSYTSMGMLRPGMVFKMVWEYEQGEVITQILHPITVEDYARVATATEESLDFDSKKRMKFNRSKDRAMKEEARSI